MRTKARVDANHTEIVTRLRECGASVLDMSRLGKGAPDIIVGFQKKNYLLEIKDGSKSPSRRVLTEDEKQFRDSWRGTYHVVESVEEALQVIGIISNKNWKEGHAR